MEIKYDKRPEVPKGVTCGGYGTHGERADAFIEYVRSHALKIMPRPHGWSDESSCSKTSKAKKPNGCSPAPKVKKSSCGSGGC